MNNMSPQLQNQIAQFQQLQQQIQTLNTQKLQMNAQTKEIERTIAELDAATGDVYNIVARSTYGEAGTNVAAIVDGSTITWDALGGSFEIQAISAAEVDAVCV